MRTRSGKWSWGGPRGGSASIANPCTVSARTCAGQAVWAAVQVNPRTCAALWNSPQRGTFTCWSGFRPQLQPSLWLGARPGELTRIGSQRRDWFAGAARRRPTFVTGSELRSSAETLGAGRTACASTRRKAGRCSCADLAVFRYDRRAQPSERQSQRSRKSEQIYRPVYIAEASARFRQAVSDRSSIRRKASRTSGRIISQYRSTRTSCWAWP